MLLPPPGNEGQKYQVVLHQGPSQPTEVVEVQDQDGDVLRVSQEKED